MTKLKPCPGCRSKNLWRGKSLTFYRQYHIECKDCFWCGKTKSTLKSAKLSWNRQRR